MPAVTPRALLPLLVAASLALLTLLPQVAAPVPAAEAAAAAFDLERYIQGKGSGFALQSNSQWRVSEDDRRPAREMGEFSPDSSSGDPARYIWSKRCKPGRQVVHFTRDVKFPGPPTFDKKPLVRIGFRDAGGIASFELKVNNRRATILLNPGFTVTLEGARARVFQKGVNDIEVIAAKRKGPCADFRGLGFTLYGTFEADLAVDQRYFSAPKVVLAPNGATVSVDIAVANNGFSLVPESAFFFNLNAGGCRYPNDDGGCGWQDYAFQINSWITGVRCKFSRPGQYAEYFKAVSGYFALYCPLKDIIPEVGEATIHIKFLPPPEHDQAWFDYESTSFWYGIRAAVGSPRDPETGNEGGSGGIVVCDTGSTNPICPR